MATAASDIGIAPNASPLASVGTSTTPDTDVSPPESPYQKGGVFRNKRLAAKKKLLSLTTEEKVWMSFGIVHR